MSITDELRKWAHGFNGPWKRHEEMLLDIADRIDKAHDKLMAESQDDLLVMDVKLEKLASTLDCLCHELGVEIGSKTDSQIHSELVEAARNTIPLPKDADGETIRIGDEVEYGHNVGTVDRLLLNESDEPRVGTTFGGYFYGTELHHVRPDSWERIIEDAYDGGFRDFDNERMRERLVERCKRLAGEDA